MYKKSYQMYGDIKLYDIPHDSSGEIVDACDEAIVKCEESFQTPKFLGMNHMAYSHLCSFLSAQADCDEIQSQQVYKGCSIVIIPVPGRGNYKYVPFVFGAFPEPDENNFFRSLTQGQFEKKKKKKK